MDKTINNFNIKNIIVNHKKEKQKKTRILWIQQESYIKT